MKYLCATLLHNPLKLLTFTSMKKVLLAIITALAAVTTMSAKPVTDVANSTSLNLGSSGYTTFSDRKLTSDAVYGGKLMPSTTNATKGYLQIQKSTTTATTTALYTVKSGGTLKSITLETASADVYLYVGNESSSSASGTAIATLNANNLTWTAKDTDNYTHFTITNSTNTTTIKSISIEWDDNEAVKPEAPVFTPNGGNIYADDVVTITCPTEGATIWYTINNGDILEYEEPISFTEEGEYTIAAFSEDANGEMSEDTPSATFTYKAKRPEFFEIVTTSTVTDTFKFDVKDAYGIKTGDSSNNNYTAENFTIPEGDAKMTFIYGSGSGCRMWTKTDSKTGAITGYDFRINKAANDGDNNSLKFAVPEGSILNTVVIKGNTLAASNTALFAVNGTALKYETNPKRATWTATSDTNEVTFEVTGSTTVQIDSIMVTYLKKEVTLIEIVEPQKPVLTVNDVAFENLEDAINLERTKKTIVLTCEEDHSIWYKYSPTAKPAEAAQADELEDEFDAEGHLNSRATRVELEIEKNGTLSFYAKHNVTGAAHDPVVIAITGDTTGIREVNAADSTPAYYDLQGRKVASPRRGLYISSEGKKLIF